MSLFDIYKAKKLGAGAGSLFDAAAGNKLSPTESFNKWDEEWVNGVYEGHQGQLNPAFTKYVASKNKIPVLPNTTYYFTIVGDLAVGRSVVYYDADGNWISDEAGFYKNKKFTTPANAYYMNFNLGGAYGGTYNNDVCINISGDRDGEYQPYGKP